MKRLALLALGLLPALVLSPTGAGGSSTRRQPHLAGSSTALGLCQVSHRSHSDTMIPWHTSKVGGVAAVARCWSR